MSEKKYGLILPSSKSFDPPKADFTKPSVFGNDSDSDEPRSKQLAIAPGTTEKRQARHFQEKALKEDPTVFQYDELYDDIESKRDQEKKAKSSEVKKPKYIGRLLEYAERRKIENERRLERAVQKEREEEGNEFADKESFVTSSYRKKLEELRELEEREKCDDYLEAIADVTKQQDLGGFYRHIYEQKMQTKVSSKEKELKAPKTPESMHRSVNKEKLQNKEPKENVKKSTTPQRKQKSPEDHHRKTGKQKASREHNKDEKGKSKTPESKRKSSSSIEDPAKTTVKPRSYRKRNASDDGTSSPEPHNAKAKKSHLQSNLDADSDFSIESSSDGDKGSFPEKKKLQSTKTPNNAEIFVQKDFKGEEARQIFNTSQESDKTADKVDDEAIKNNEQNDSKLKIKKWKKGNKDIWKKRTVEAVFEAALQRYRERKVSRQV